MIAIPRVLVEWQDDYSLELPEIDDQHKALFDLINRLWDALVRRAGKDEVAAIISELESYTQTHFTAEETLMRLAGYPRLAEHQASHAEFMKLIAREKEKVAAGARLDMEMINFLTDWLAKHIKVADKDYARFYVEQQTPRSTFQKLFTKFF